ncbi:hypothetical protein FEK35_23150 [Nocardia cyriacigeorgica]|uniref:Uncharacterized protein n=1 Tax=Nocardia cyriacigeorgica TaxID=135487 RepID=A0A5R8P8S1_9NOCA|nr:hypothetical protein [Nocardia cyriacigeorgica]TLG01761.1 hypothetical protein FEK35_23150 [Nocardia cyriacigeorgica]
MTSALPTGLHPPDDPRAADVVEHTRIDIAGPEAIAIVTDFAAFQFASKWSLRDREGFVSVVRELTVGFVNSAAALSPRPASVMLRLRWTRPRRDRDRLVGQRRPRQWPPLPPLCHDQAPPAARPSRTHRTPL